MLDEKWRKVYRANSPRGLIFDARFAYSCVAAATRIRSPGSIRQHVAKLATDDATPSVIESGLDGHYNRPSARSHRRV